ncbi:MAG: DUF4956 domain-containing protein [Aeromicrobium sp.]
MDLTTILELLSRFGLDILSLLLLAGVLYRPRLAAPEMPLVFTSLNLGLFAAVMVISGHHFSAGIGFGLFGLLSLVRLRSTTFTLKDIAYTFIALVLGLANGLTAAPLTLVIAVNLTLLGALAIADESRRSPSTGVMHVTLHRALVDPERIRDEARDQLPANIVSIVVDSVDHVREITRLTVHYEPDAKMATGSDPTALVDGQGATR